MSNEQEILKENKEFRISVDYNGFVSTECFSKDIFDGNYNYKIRENTETKQRIIEKLKENK